MRVGTPLRCVECGREADETGEGWRAHLAVADEADEELDTAVFCPECAAREFLERPEAGS
jgi:DNA-directed RNA polymerase subunit RPC12/RpoP